MTTIELILLGEISMWCHRMWGNTDY